MSANKESFPRKPIAALDQASAFHCTRDSLITEHLPVVKLVAKRLTAKLPPWIEPDDVHSAGVMGLIDAAAKFDERRGVKFRSYAEIRVHGAIVDYLRSLSWAPRGLHRRAKEIDAARLAIEQQNCGTATVAELANELGISVDDCHKLLMRVDKLALDQVDSIGVDSRSSLASVASHDCDPLKRLEGKALFELVWRAVEALPERESMVLWLYYYEELTMKEIGAVINVNEARVSQLHSKAIATLRLSVKQALPSEHPKLPA
jgi:RNA polymerase sigma factor for flagellar operon FliA